MRTIIVVEKERPMVDFIRGLLEHNNFWSTYVRLTESNPEISVARIRRVIQSDNNPLIITCMFYEKFNDGLELVRQCYGQADFILHTIYAAEDWVKEAAEELGFRPIMKCDWGSLLSAVHYFDSENPLHRLGVPF